MPAGSRWTSATGLNSRKHRRTENASAGFERFREEVFRTGRLRSRLASCSHWPISPKRNSRSLEIIEAERTAHDEKEDMGARSFQEMLIRKLSPR